VDETGAVVGYDDYDPWGKVLAGRSLATPWSAGQGTAMNKFNSIPVKTKTSCFQIGMKSSGITRINAMDITYNTFGALYYDADVGRFLTIDRVADKYPFLTPYQYSANNPALFVDVNGDSINVKQIQQYDKQNGTHYLNNIIKDLKEQTGLNFSVNRNGQLVYAIDKDGNAIVATKNGKKVGSEKARNVLEKAISNLDQAFSVISQKKSSVPVNGSPLIRLNPSQIENFIKGTSSDLNSKTLGWGMIFIHEVLHSNVGGSLTDPPLTAGFGPKGAVVNIMNIIRSQLRNYGIRSSYQGIRLPNGSAYLPFSPVSKIILERGLIPLNRVIQY